MSHLRKAEWGAALVLTFVVLCLHVMAATSAGPLWRDEANTVALATLPRLGDVWRNLQFDSFPMLWVLVVRWLATLSGPMNDTAFRVVGFLIGSGIVGALWLNARAFGYEVPLVSLALLAMSPSLIRWGDTMRAYGFGILLALLTCAALWRLADRPSARRLAVAGLFAVASVQTLYYNAVVLLAFCAGAAAVCAHRRDRKTVGLILLVGLIAAASLLPYRSTIQQASNWNMLVRIPSYNLPWFWNSFAKAVDVGWLELRFVWSALLAVALSFGVLALTAPRRVRLPAAHYDAMLFLVVSLLVGVPGMLLFLRALSYHTAPWYYLALLALTGLCIDGILGVGIHGPRLRVVRLAAILALAIAAFIPTRRLVRTRLSDVDIVSAKIQELARPGDFIIVAPWHYGVSFTRYYRGNADWMTVPPISPVRFHRYDLLKTQMMRADQTAPAREVTSRAASALRNGHHVFIAGVLAEPEPGTPVRVLKAVTPRSRLWAANNHEAQWSMMVSQEIFKHATTRRYLPIDVDRVVSPYENMTLQVVEGWRNE